MNKKLEKGDYAYLGKKKRIEIIKTVILFGISLAVFLTGYLQTGKRENLLTVVAILGVLPASKSAVSMIMFVRYRQAERMVYEQLKIYQDKAVVLYDLIFVLNQQPVKSECVFIYDSNVVFYTKNEKQSESDIMKQLKNFLSNHGKGNCRVLVCKNQKKFFEQVKSVGYETQNASELYRQDCEIRDKLLAFSM